MTLEQYRLRFGLLTLEAALRHAWREGDPDRGGVHDVGFRSGTEPAKGLELDDALAMLARDPADIYVEVACAAEVNFTAGQQWQARMSFGAELIELGTFENADAAENVVQKEAVRRGYRVTSVIHDENNGLDCHMTLEPIAKKSRPELPSEKVRRNAPCPCGSGRKWKKCCR